MSLVLTNCPIPTCQAKLFGGDCSQLIPLYKGSQLKKHYYTYGTNFSGDIAHMFLGKSFAICWLEVSLELQMKFINSMQDFISTDNMIKYNNVSLEDAIKMYQRLDNLKAFI